MYDPGQLVPFVQHLEAVRAGIMDIAVVVPGYYQNEFALSSLWNYMYTFYRRRRNSKWHKISKEDQEAMGPLLRRISIGLEPTGRRGLREVHGSKAQKQSSGVTISEWPDPDPKSRRLMEGWKPLMVRCHGVRQERRCVPAQYMLDAMHQWLEDNKGKYE